LITQTLGAPPPPFFGVRAVGFSATRKCLRAPVSRDRTRVHWYGRDTARFCKASGALWGWPDQQGLENLAARGRQAMFGLRRPPSAQTQAQPNCRARGPKKKSRLLVLPPSRTSRVACGRGPLSFRKRARASGETKHCATKAVAKFQRAYPVLCVEEVVALSPRESGRLQFTDATAGGRVNPTPQAQHPLRLVGGLLTTAPVDLALQCSPRRLILARVDRWRSERDDDRPPRTLRSVRPPLPSSADTRSRTYLIEHQAGV